MKEFSYKRINFTLSTCLSGQFKVTATTPVSRKSTTFTSHNTQAYDRCDTYTSGDGQFLVEQLAKKELYLEYLRNK